MSHLNRAVSPQRKDVSMKRTSMFVSVAMVFVFVCSFAYAQCPGGNCNLSYGYGWWPWFGYQYVQQPQTRASNGSACRRCDGPACAKVEQEEAVTVPATEDVAEAVVPEEPAPSTEPVSAIAEESLAPTANPSLNPVPVEPLKEQDGAQEQESDDPSEENLCPFAARVIWLINQQRASVGLPMLKADMNLVNGCQSHSQWMLSYGFQHASGGGRECIAMGVNTPESLVNLWMNSSGHRAIIMGWGTWIGIGSAGTYHTLRIR